MRETAGKKRKTVKVLGAAQSKGTGCQTDAKSPRTSPRTPKLAIAAAKRICPTLFMRPQPLLTHVREWAF